jgi:hypothetical protein
MVKVHELLASGDWVDREHLVTTAMPLVPPGKAERQAKVERDRHDAARRRRGDPVIRANSKPSDSVAVGARIVVAHSLGTAVGQGRLQRRRLPDGRIQIRLNPPS